MSCECGCDSSAPESKHRGLFRIHDLDIQSVRVHLHINRTEKLFELGGGSDLLLYLFGSFLELFFLLRNFYHLLKSLLRCI